MLPGRQWRENLFILQLKQGVKMGSKPGKPENKRAETPENPVSKKGRYLHVNRGNCRSCLNRPCVKVCPSGVFSWDNDSKTLNVFPEYCIDWGACLFICPYDAITWSDEGAPPPAALKGKKTKEQKRREEEFAQRESERMYILGILPEETAEPDFVGAAPTFPDNPSKEEKTEHEQVFHEPGKVTEKNSSLTSLALGNIIASRIKNISLLTGKRKSGLSDNRERENLRVAPEGRNERARVLLLFLALTIFLLTLFFLNRELVALREEAVERIEKGVYYSSVDNDWQGWDGNDYELNNGVLTLKQDIYYAPYFRRRLAADDFPWEDIVIKMTTRLEDFGGTNYNLFTIYTTTGDLSFITDHLGRLGIARDPDFMPEYSKAVLSSDEHVIHFFLNTSQNEISIFVDGSLVFIEERDLFMVSLLEVWLGAFWVGGGNAYGPPISHEVSEFIIGDSDLLYFGYSFKQFLSDKLHTDPWLWIILFLPLLLILIYLFLFFTGLKKRKSEEFGEYTEEWDIDD